MMGLPPLLRQQVTGFAIDHRKLRPGHVFGAFQGAQFDAEKVIPDAIRAGAIAVVARPQAVVSGAVHLADDQPRRLFAQLAAEYYAPYPATVAAITGTNGKTSTADLLRQFWTMDGKASAAIGTLGVTGVPASQIAGHSGLTTPDILTFLQTASALQQHGISHLAFEASSHGLSQYRSEGLPVAAAAFTNLTRDHLDYHRTMADYFAAKQRLFSEVVAADGTAIVWLDDKADGAQWNRRMMDVAGARGLRLLTVGPDGDDIRLLQQVPTENGQRLQLNLFGSAVEMALPLIGGYQAANALLAMALAVATGSDARQLLAYAGQLTGVPGRLEQAAITPDGAPVYVDYAHTADALQAALCALRPHAQGRLLLVFGCGGDRDPGKRPQMGAVAARLADRIFITDDNPRSEDPALIRTAILAVAPDAVEIADRGTAIAAAMAEARAGDIVLLAGKGHEQGQIVGNDVLPFDDRDVARRIAGGSA